MLLTEKRNFATCFEASELSGRFADKNKDKDIFFRLVMSTHLAARLGRHFERGLEGSALLRGQDGSWPLGTLVLLALIGTLSPAAGAHAAVLVLAFH